MTLIRFLPVFLIGIVLLACGSGGGSSPSEGVLIEEVAAPMPNVAFGGKPEAPPTTAPTANTTAPSTATAPPSAAAPSTGRWIEVDVTNFRVRLMDGTAALKTIGPVAVGVQINTGVYESTQTGLFRVHNKIGGLQYDAPYKTYISDWVGFDAARANGFHSFLKDAGGAVVDASTGRISNGCIRTADAKAIFDFAEIGMPVYVHL